MLYSEVLVYDLLVVRTYEIYWFREDDLDFIIFLYLLE